MSTRSPAKMQALQRGAHGAVAAAHPLAVSAGLAILRAGGSAADAAIAAQAVLCVVMPDACSLGGDMLALLHRPGQDVVAINGTGAAPARLRTVANDGANSITVPGIVAAWCDLAQRAGRLGLARLLEPAAALAASGVPVSQSLGAALARQRDRLLRGGAASWALFDRSRDVVVPQENLARLLRAIAARGREAFYSGAAAAAIVSAIEDLGGALNEQDLAAHETVLAAPLAANYANLRILVQPPMSQGVLLQMALHAFAQLGDVPEHLLDHVAIELTNAAFASRDDVGQGATLLDRPLTLDRARATNRGGPRAYLHTAGVAAVDEAGMVVSSLVSVFDDFGSCVYVPELGITLNNRAGGFTAGANAAEPGKRPVHTLAPILLCSGDDVYALATPGADGQVQTLLQIIIGLQRRGLDLASAIAALRWRSENGRLLVESGHPGSDELERLGHRLEVLAEGDVRFGAVVAAGTGQGGAFAVADWRRETASGAL